MYAGHNSSATPIKTGSIIDARDELECNAESRVTVTDARMWRSHTHKITWSRLKGNMCASAIGTVRVQSRRKSEMFLTCTNSCTREKMHAPLAKYVRANMEGFITRYMFVNCNSQMSYL